MTISTVSFPEADLVRFTCTEGHFINGDSDFLTSDQFAEALESAWTDAAAEEYKHHQNITRASFTFIRCSFRSTPIPFSAPILDVMGYKLEFIDCTFDGCPLFDRDFEESEEEEFEEYVFENCAFKNCGMVRLYERDGFQECGIVFRRCSHAGELEADANCAVTAEAAWQKGVRMQAQALVH